MTEQNEPSMEDILASIRNILAEGEDNGPKSAPASAAQPAARQVAEQPSAEQDGVESRQPAAAPAEQTTAAARSESKKAGQPAAPVAGKQGGVMDLTAEMIVPPKASVQPAVDEEDDFTPEPVIPDAPMKEETLSDLIKETARNRFDDDDLQLAEPTLAAATESLSHLRSIASEKRLSLGKGDLTIEAIVRETLKPYLKEWLDVNLPDIVERVVKKEVAHIMDRLDLK